MERDQFAGMTIPEMKKADPDRHEVIFTEWEISTYGGFSWAMDSLHGGTPKNDVSEAAINATRDGEITAPVKAIYYGNPNWGGRAHGLDVWVEKKRAAKAFSKGKEIGDVAILDGEWVEVFYETPAEQEARRVKGIAEADRRRREGLAEEKPRLDAEFHRLPRPLQRRIEVRRHNNPNFRLENEGYEMRVCSQAARFAEQALLTTEAPLVDVGTIKADSTHVCIKGVGYGPGVAPHMGWVRDSDGALGGEAHAKAAFEWLQKWMDLDSKKRAYEMPGLSKDHSGNSFGAAVTLALIYLQTVEGTIRQHGALAMINGSEAYGDPEPGEPLPA